MIDQTRFFVTQKYKVANAVATGVINANDIVITSDTHELLFVDDRNQVIPITTTKEEIGLGNVTNNAQINGRASGIVPGHVMTWGANGYTANDSGYTIASNVPANAVFTDTTYQVATPYAGGLLSGSDKEKLDSIERGAQVNVTYNTATQSTAGLMSAADKTKLDNMDGSTAPAYDPATTTADGLMSASDKAKLDGIESGAQVNVEYPVATPVKNGLMSAADKTKLDGLSNDDGSGDGGVLIINIFTDSDNFLRLDKTFAEINQAVNSGKACVIKHGLGQIGYVSHAITMPSPTSQGDEERIVIEISGNMEYDGEAFVWKPTCKKWTASSDADNPFS